MVNEPYSEGPGPDGDGKGSGQFTHKVYHIGRWQLIILKVGHICNASAGHFIFFYTCKNTVESACGVKI